jgi:transketolase
MTGPRPELPQEPRATRFAFGDALLRVGADPRIVVVGADLNKSTRAELFAHKYPDRFFEVGVAEQNMLGVAAGLALCGKIAWCSSFSCFVVGRFETLRMSIAYQGANVRVVGTHAGIGTGEDGYSQMGQEDIALARTLPGMAVLQPADDVEAERMVEYLVEHQGPVFLRLTRQKLDRVHGADYEFQFGRLDVLRDGGDVTLLATGATVGHAMAAADALRADGVQASVGNVHTIKPLDEGAILEMTAGKRLVVTVEDHSVIGGLGSAVSELFAERRPTRVHRVGTRDVFGESGSPAALYEKHHLDAPGIRKEVLAALG